MENVEKKPKISFMSISIAIIVLLVIVVGAVIAFVTGFFGDEIKYGSTKAKALPENNFSIETEDDEVKIISFNSEASTVAIPKKFDGNKLKVIGEESFRENNSIHKALIPDGVEVIEDKAFYYCMNLQYVYIPESVTEIGLNSFMGNGDNFTVYGEKNSYAEEFCKKHSIQFKEDK